MIYMHDQWAQCNAMQLIHWNTFEKTINNVNDLDQAV